jgi:hypothetical protein
VRRGSLRYRDGRAVDLEDAPHPPRNGVHQSDVVAQHLDIAEYVTQHSAGVGGANAESGDDLDAAYD